MCVHVREKDRQEDDENNNLFFCKTHQEIYFIGLHFIFTILNSIFQISLGFPQPKELSREFLSYNPGQMVMNYLGFC